MSYKRNKIDGYNKSIIQYGPSRALLNNEINSVDNAAYKDLLDRYGLVTQQLTDIQQQLIAINTALGLSGASVNFANQASLNLGNRFKVNCSTSGQSVNFGNTSDTNDVTDNQLVFAPGNTAPNSANGIVKLQKDAIVLNDSKIYFRSSGKSTFQTSNYDPNHSIGYNSANDGVAINSFLSTMIKQNGTDKFAINASNVTSSVDIIGGGKVKVGTGGIRLDYTNGTDNNKGSNRTIDFGQDTGLIAWETLPDVVSSNGRSILSLAAYEGVSLGYRDSTVNSYAFNRLLQADRWGVAAYRQFRAPNTFQTGYYSVDKTYEWDEITITFPQTMATVPAVFLQFDAPFGIGSDTAAGGQNPPGPDSNAPVIFFPVHNVYSVTTTGFKCNYNLIKFNWGTNDGSSWGLAHDTGATSGAHFRGIEMIINESKTQNFRWFAICS